MTGTPEARLSDRTLLKGYLHKTSNSLCGIKGYASLLADPEREDADAGRWARKILAEIEKLEEIFRSVGTLTPDRGHPDLGIELSGLVRDVGETAGSHHRNVDLRVGFLPEGDLLLPVADVRLIIGELLANSAESRDEADGPVMVTIEGRVTSEGRIELEMTDDGPGLGGTLADRAADPFVTTKEGHLGIGLTRVATLLEMYGLAWGIGPGPAGGMTVVLEIAETTE